MNINQLFKKKSKQRKDYLITFGIRIILLALVVINIYPVIFTIITSLKNTNDFYDDVWGLPKKLFLENYINGFTTGHLGEYFINSVIIAIVTITVTIVLGVFAAYALARLKVPFVELIVALLMIIQILPTESMIIPLYILVSKSKITSIPYLPMIVAYTGWLLPASIVILKNFFQTIPTELLEAARIDGSSEINTMFKVVMPLTGGAIATTVVLNFCFVWGELMWAQIATLTSDKGIPLTVGLLNFQGQYGTDWGPMTAAICMVLLPLFLLFLFLQKYFVQGLTSGGVKG